MAAAIVAVLFLVGFMLFHLVMAITFIVEDIVQKVKIKKEKKQ